MAIETWGAANNATRHRRAKPTISTTKHQQDRVREAGLTPLQQDMVSLRLDPLRPMRDTSQLISVVRRKWPPGPEPDDLRPRGWGWAQAQAYARLSAYLAEQQHQFRPRPRR